DGRTQARTVRSLNLRLRRKGAPARSPKQSIVVIIRTIERRAAEQPERIEMRPFVPFFPIGVVRPFPTEHQFGPLGAARPPGARPFEARPLGGGSFGARPLGGGPFGAGPCEARPFGGCPFGLVCLLR